MLNVRCYSDQMNVARPQRPSSAQGFYSNYDMSVHSFESGKKQEVVEMNLFRLKCASVAIFLDALMNENIYIRSIFSSARDVTSLLELSLNEVF